MDKKLKSFLWGFGITSGVLVGISITNKIITESSTKNNYLSSKNCGYFDYKLGKVYYTKCGEGSPIVLINNNLSGYGTGYEYSKLEKVLATDHTVYCVDLLGTGKSDKPNIIYTSFMFAQIIVSFINEVVGEKAKCVASGTSCSYLVMAALLKEDNFSEIILLNPEKINNTAKTTNTFLKARYFVEASPIIGTFIYNIKHSKALLVKKVWNDWMSNVENFRTSDYKSFYKAAHLGGYRSKYLTASERCRCTKLNISYALEKLSLPIHIVSSVSEENFDIANDYVEANHNIKCDFIGGCAELIAFEKPVRLGTIIDR